MKKISILIISATAVFMVACQKDESSYPDIDKLNLQELTEIGYKPVQLTSEEIALTKKINDFGYGVYKQLFKNEDMLFSPVSLSIALAMATTGAEGNTELELLNTMGFEGNTSDDLGNYYAGMIDHFAQADPTTTLSIANAIWSNYYIRLKDSFSNGCKKYFNSTAESVDFRDPGTLTKINEWASEHTNGMIRKILNEIDPDTAAILANALYLSAKWPFDFTRSGDRMIAKVKTIYFEGEDYCGVELPYGNGTFAMRIVLPSKTSSLDKLVSDISGDWWQRAKRENALVSLDIPTFSFGYMSSLPEALKSLGIKDAFSGNANFAKMTDYPLFISDIIQKTSINVDEKGTEAAAVTCIMIKVTSMVQESPRGINFKIDSDFLFEIVDRNSGVVIFIGQHKM